MIERKKTIHINEFKNNDQVLAKDNNAEVLLIKSNDEYFAITSKCGHLGVGLKGGKVNSEEKTITCPWHDSQFFLKNRRDQAMGHNEWHKEISIILHT